MTLQGLVVLADAGDSTAAPVVELLKYFRESDTDLHLLLSHLLAVPFAPFGPVRVRAPRGFVPRILPNYFGENRGKP
jgi:hypothetical protein